MLWTVKLETGVHKEFAVVMELEQYILSFHKNLNAITAIVPQIGITNRHTRT